MALAAALRSVGFLDVSQRIRLREPRSQALQPQPFLLSRYGSRQEVRANIQNHLEGFASKAGEKSGLIEESFLPVNLGQRMVFAMRSKNDKPDNAVLARVFMRYPGIRAVYLFGSRVSGEIHDESDMDFAIVPQDESIRRKKLDLLADLARQGFCNVDLLFLDTDDIVFKYEAIRQNCLIYQTDDFDRGTMYSGVVRKYLDFLPYLEVQREAYRRRILHDQT